MFDFIIREEVKEKCPNVVLGLIEADVTVSDSCDELIKEMDICCDEEKDKIRLEELASCREIKDGREAYKSLGKSPSKYRLSSEALLRRVLQCKGLYRVNNIVDINNIISLKSKFPVGSYDLSNITAPVYLNRAEESATYKGIGKDYLNIEHLPVLVDEDGAFGSPTSDSQRAMITEKANRIVICIYSFSGRENLEEYLDEAENLMIKYANGCNFERKIVE